MKTTIQQRLGACAVTIQQCERRFAISDCLHSLISSFPTWYVSFFTSSLSMLKIWPGISKLFVASAAAAFSQGLKHCICTLGTSGFLPLSFLSCFNFFSSLLNLHVGAKGKGWICSARGAYMYVCMYSTCVYR